MDDVRKVTDQLEYLFLNQIADDLIGEKIKIPDAQRMAGDFLQRLPFISIEDAQVKMGEFTRPYVQFGILKDYVDGYYQEKQKDAMINKMRAHLREGRIDDALKIVQK